VFVGFSTASSDKLALKAVLGPSIILQVAVVGATFAYNII
jgi:hypothetical protein